MCPCGQPSRPTGGALGLHGHGVRDRQLRGPTAATFREALARAEARVQAARAIGDGRRYETGGLSAGLALRGSMPIGPLRAALDLTGGAKVFTLNGERVVRPTANLTLLLLYGI